MEDDTTWGKMNKSQIQCYNCQNIVSMLMNIEVSLKMWKDKITFLKRNIKKNLPSCWCIKDKVKRKTHDTLTLEHEIICVDLKLFIELDESKSDQ